MSEPREPGSAPESEPETDAVDATPDATPDAAPDATPDVAPDATPDVAPEPEVAPEAGTDAPEAVLDEPAPEPAKKNQQPLFIAIALVVTLAIAGGVAALAVALGGDDEDKKQTPEEQAKAAAVALLEGTYKSAKGDESGCRQMTDNLILSPEQGDFFDKCVEQTKKVGDQNEGLTIDSVVATEATLDDAAGTGTVKVDVTATNNGTTETKNAPVPVKKVDGVWKVNPLG